MAATGFLHLMCRKTKMCKYFARGRCTRQPCDFAHSPEELQPVPNLSCTKVCPTLLRTGRCDDVECTFAHRRSELRRLPTARAGGHAARRRLAMEERERQAREGGALACFSRQTTPGGLPSLALLGSPRRCNSAGSANSVGSVVESAGTAGESSDGEENLDSYNRPEEGLMSPGFCSDDEKMPPLPRLAGPYMETVLKQQNRALEPASTYPTLRTALEAASDDASKIVDTRMSLLPFPDAPIEVRVQNTFITVAVSEPRAPGLPRNHTMPDLSMLLEEGERMPPDAAQDDSEQDSSTEGEKPHWQPTTTRRGSW